MARIAASNKTLEDLSVLIVPMFSKETINSDSNYVILTQWIEALEKVRPGWQFFVIFPSSTSGFKYDDDGFFRRKNVIRISQNINKRKMGNAIAFDATFYDKVFRNYVFDVVLCHLVECAGHLQNAGIASYEHSSLPVTIASHNYVIHKSLPYVMTSMENVLIQQLHGAILADINLFNSDHCMQMLKDNAEEYLSQTQIDRIFDDYQKIPLCVLDDRFYFHKNKNEVPVIIYNHRLQAYKNFQKTFQILEELWNEGYKFKVKYTNSNMDSLSKINSYPFVEINLCKTREEYIKVLETADLGVINSQHETFCISAIESMAMGAPLIAPNGITFPEITGRDEIGYPFLFNKTSEQKDYLRLLLKDEDERHKWGKKVSDYVLKTYHKKEWARQYIEIFERAYYRYMPAERSLYIIDHFLNKHKEIYFWDLMNECYRFRDDRFKNVLSSQSLTPNKLIKMIRAAGGKVKFDHAKDDYLVSRG